MEENKNEQELNDTSANNSEQKSEIELESNAARRLRLLGIENDSKIHDEKVEIKEGNFWANLWYKRKWAIIITAFFIVLAIILACTLLFKNSPDLTIGYIGPADLTKSEKAKIVGALSEYMDNYDGDKKKELVFNTTTYRSPKQQGPDTNASIENSNEIAANAFYDDIRYNNYMMVLIDESLYSRYKDAFYTRKELVEMGANLDELDDAFFYEERGIIFNYTMAAKDNKAELGDLTDETVILCFCKRNVMGKKLNNEIDFLNQIIAYETEAKNK